MCFSVSLGLERGLERTDLTDEAFEESIPQAFGSSWAPQSYSGTEFSHFLVD